MKTGLIVIICVVLTMDLSSQSKSEKNNHLFLEGLGSLPYYSVNFEKTIYRSTNFRDYIRVGVNVIQDSWTISLWPNKSFGYYLQYGTAFLLGTEHGTKKWRREFSAGLTIYQGEPVRQYNIVAKLGDKYFDFGLTSSVGFRYYPKKTPLFFRFAYTPLYAFRQKKFLPFVIGVSIGYKF